MSDGRTDAMLPRAAALAGPWSAGLVGLVYWFVYLRPRYDGS